MASYTCKHRKCEVKMHECLTFVPSLATIAREVDKPIHQLTRQDVESFVRCMTCKNTIRRCFPNCRMHTLHASLKKLDQVKAEKAARRLEVEQKEEERAAAREVEKSAAHKRRRKNLARRNQRFIATACGESRFAQASA